jgi:hypothetical protein
VSMRLVGFGNRGRREVEGGRWMLLLLVIKWRER